MITVEIKDAEVLAMLNRLAKRGSNPRPALLAIGEELADSTLKRFETSTGPDGSRWAPNSPVTLLRKRGDKPLIGAGKALSTQIHYRVAADAVYIGSPMIYAAVQQFGARKGAFGTSRRGGPLPWGDIPARPFLGISADDRKTIDAIIRDHMVE